MSPRAAWRLEQMGFDAYDYTGGKADWISEGWETERADEARREARDVMAPDFATCSLTEDAEALMARVAESGSLFVVNEEGILLGRVGAHQLHDAPPGATAEEVMRPGPTTVRPFEPFEPLVGRMRKATVAEMAVTSSEGRLIGVVRLES